MSASGEGSGDGEGDGEGEGDGDGVGSSGGVGGVEGDDEGGGGPGGEEGGGDGGTGGSAGGEEGEDEGGGGSTGGGEGGSEHWPKSSTSSKLSVPHSSVDLRTCTPVTSLAAHALTNGPKVADATLDAHCVQLAELAVGTASMVYETKYSPRYS